MGYFQQALEAETKQHFDTTAEQFLDCSKECRKRKLIKRSNEAEVKGQMVAVLQAENGRLEAQLRQLKIDAQVQQMTKTLQQKHASGEGAELNQTLIDQIAELMRQKEQIEEQLQSEVSLVSERVAGVEAELADERSRHRIDVKELEGMQDSMLQELSDRDTEMERY